MTEAQLRLPLAEIHIQNNSKELTGSWNWEVRGLNTPGSTGISAFLFDRQLGWTVELDAPVGSLAAGSGVGHSTLRDLMSPSADAGVVTLSTSQTWCED